MTADRHQIGLLTSPLTFAIFIEPLIAAIRQNKDIKGIQCKNLEHKMRLYADDVLLFLQNSQTSLSQTVTLIEKFSSISVYSINWSKSTVLSINCNFLKIPTTTLQSGIIRYLCINISPRLSDLTKLIYVQLIKTIEDNRTYWSLMGRVAAIKIMVLLKINYFFLIIPIKPSSTYLSH